MNKILGVPEETWNQAKEEIRVILIERAKQRSFISYSELVSKTKTLKLSYDSILLFHMLGQISREEDKKGRGMLSVLVVHKEGRFYELAKDLGRNVTDEIMCWVEEFKKVHAFWMDK